MIIEFIAKRNNIKLEGFIDTKEIEDDECIQFYNNQGVENGYNLPTNPYNDELEMEKWNDYEKLITCWNQDDMFLKFLLDYKNKYYKTKRPGYTLIINPDLKEK